MLKFKNFSEVHAYLSTLMSETRGRHEAYTLDRIREVLKLLGNPQDSYRTIHAAGTSGKSSTCFFLSAMLAAAGQKTGLTVSPHLNEVNERLQIDNQPLDESQFCRELGVFVGEIENCGIWLSYFELLVAFAYWEFARQNVDYAVIETGLGGLLDGTNVITRQDKICVITDIGFDHTSVLGKTLPEITAQKAGIILPGNTVFSYKQGEEIMNVLREICRDKNARLHEVTPATDAPADLPLFQQRNWQLAKTVFRYAAKRDQLPPLAEDELSATAATQIPGRMETLHVKDKTVLLDGAHNPQKLGALVESIKSAYPGQKFGCLISFVRNPEAKIRDNLAAVLPITSSLVITGFDDDEAEHHSTDPEVVARQCDSLGFENYRVIPELDQALDALLNLPDDKLLVAGSFFLLQPIRPLIINTNDSPHSSNR